MYLLAYLYLYCLSFVRGRVGFNLFFIHSLGEKKRKEKGLGIEWWECEWLYCRSEQQEEETRLSWKQTLNSV
jgi:hypothetical protein